MSSAAEVTPSQPKFSLPEWVRDPRVAVAFILFSYLVLGFTLLGFNRSPWQVAVTSLSACLLEVGLTWTLKRKIIFPLSALVTSFGLSILLNYSHSFGLLFVPVLIAIGSKYVLTFNGKHAYNPAQLAVTLCLLFSQGLITSAPAYQWNGIANMALFVAMPGLFYIMPAVKRMPLITSFLISYTFFTALRAVIMRHHLPFETLFLGTLSSPSFFLFTFFMITDPATSPSARKDQIVAGISIAFIDLLYHIGHSYYTFFFAAFTFASFKFIRNHYRALQAQGNVLEYFKTKFWDSGYYFKPAVVGLVALSYYGLYSSVLNPVAVATPTTWKFVKQSDDQTGITAHFGNVYNRVDKRIQHIIKWVFSVGDGVATGDVDGDGRPDLFLTSVLMSDEERGALYLNKGNFKFERFHIPELDARLTDIETFGVPTNAMFVDYNNCGCLSLFITYASGSPVLFRNKIKETGKLEFEDVTVKAGLHHYTNSIAATWTDLNRDGLLDLVVVNVLPNTLPDYDTPKELNFFHLPQAEYPGDERMFHFMHKSWHEADNGGANEIWLQQPDHSFVKQDNKSWNFTETRWSLAVGAADFNHDGWPDLYIANDFGPDELYYNKQGKSFEQIKGKMFGSIGRDTYKGMNVSIADFDHNGFQDVSVSNVHHALQAEGSLLWMFGPSKQTFFPEMSDQATYTGMLNENRFGWGASASDFDNDGWIDLAQANGMVDDSIDRRFESCPDYWYTNEKIARSPPSIHSYANRWGDIRGYCIYGKEQNRLYLNKGKDAKPMFVDVASQVGLPELTNSRGIASVDFENNGRRGMVVTHMFQEPSFYKNEGPLTDPNEWIGFDLVADGTTCNKSGVGSTVTLSYDQNGKRVTQTQEKQVATGFEAQNDPRVHFGLGHGATNLQVSVKWCGGTEATSSNILPNSYQTLHMNSF